MAAFGSGFSFALSDVLTRVASREVPRNILVLISLTVGAPYLWVAGIVVGEPMPPVRELVLFVIIGIVHFGLARYLFYTAIVGLGASSAAIMVSPVIIISSILAWIFLDEPLSKRGIIGAMLVTIAIFLASRNPSGAPLQGVSRLKALVSGITATLIFSISSVVVRYAASSSGSPIIGAAISYTSAYPIILAMVFIGGNNLSSLKSLHKKYLVIAVISGLIVTSAQLFRYVALSMVNVLDALILISLFPIHTLVLSAVMSRESKEKIGMIHIIASLIAVSGVVLALSAS